MTDMEKENLEMNTISYEGVVFTRSAMRVYRAADKSLRAFAGANHMRPD